jgi:hypothetical protein
MNLMTDLKDQAKHYSSTALLEGDSSDVAKAFMAGVYSVKAELEEIVKGVDKNNKLYTNPSQFMKGQLDGMYWLIDFLEDFDEA